MLLAAEHAGHVAKSVDQRGFAFMTIWTTAKEFYSTTGSAITQVLRQAGAGCGVSALGRDKDVQTRGGPGDFALFQGGGYEVVERASLHALMPEYGREAVMLANAPPLPSGVRDLMLDGSVLNLQMHESIGHRARTRSLARLGSEFFGRFVGDAGSSRQTAVRQSTCSTSMPTTRCRSAWRRSVTTTKRVKPAARAA